MLCTLCQSADAPASYKNDFENTAIGKPSDEFMILNGVFNVVQQDKNKCLELDPDPIDGDGLLFGPPGRVTGTVAARIWGSASGKRFPEFGVGANDAGGFKLIVVPARGRIEFRLGDEAVASASYDWKSDTWTRLRLHITAIADGKYAIDGFACPEGAPEPQKPLISTTDTVAPYAGRASVWGMPYSEKPIRFDDLSYDP
jgi:hypothetical protein